MMIIQVNSSITNSIRNISEYSYMAEFKSLKSVKIFLLMLKLFEL